MRPPVAALAPSQPREVGPAPNRGVAAACPLRCGLAGTAVHTAQTGVRLPTAPESLEEQMRRLNKFDGCRVVARRATRGLEASWQQRRRFAAALCLAPPSAAASSEFYRWDGGAGQGLLSISTCRVSGQGDHTWSGVRGGSQRMLGRCELTRLTRYADMPLCATSSSALHTGKAAAWRVRAPLDAACGATAAGAAGCRPMTQLHAASQPSIHLSNPCHRPEGPTL